MRRAWALRSVRRRGVNAAGRAGRRVGLAAQSPGSPGSAAELPPALQRQEHLLLYAAKQRELIRTEGAPILYDDKALANLVPSLCAQDRVRDVCGNVVYQALEALKRPDADAQQRFLTDLYSACTMLFETHFVHENAEAVFAVLNREMVKVISPSLRRAKRKEVENLMQDGLARWVWLNQHCFGRMSVDRLFEIVGCRAFVRLIAPLQINVRLLSTNALDVLFHVLLKDAPTNIFAAMDVAFAFESETLRSPLGGSTWALRDILDHIEERQSEHMLDAFLDRLAVQQCGDRLMDEALGKLRERSPDSGVLRSSWAFRASLRRLEGRAQAALTPSCSGAMPLLPYDDEIATMPPPQGLQCTFVGGEMGSFRLDFPAFPVTTSLEPTPHTTMTWSKWSAEAQSPTALKEVQRPWAWDEHERLLPEQVFLVDSVETMAEMQVILRYRAEETVMVGLNYEFSGNSPLSVFLLSLPGACFCIDMRQKSDLFAALTHHTLSAVLEDSALVKVVLGCSQMLYRLNAAFGNFGLPAIQSSQRVVDLENQRVRRAIRSVAPAPRALQVEDNLREAVETGNVEQLFGKATAAPPAAAEPAAVGEEGEEEGLLPAAPASAGAAGAVEEVTVVHGARSIEDAARRLHLDLHFAGVTEHTNWNFRPLSYIQVLESALRAHGALRVERAWRARGALPVREWFSRTPRPSKPRGVA